MKGEEKDDWHRSLFSLILWSKNYDSSKSYTGLIIFDVLVVIYIWIPNRNSSLYLYLVCTRRRFFDSNLKPYFHRKPMTIQVVNDDGVKTDQ